MPAASHLLKPFASDALVPPKHPSCTPPPLFLSGANYWSNFILFCVLAVLTVDRIHQTYAPSPACTYAAAAAPSTPFAGQQWVQHAHAAAGNDQLYRTQAVLQHLHGLFGPVSTGLAHARPFIDLGVDGLGLWQQVNDKWTALANSFSVDVASLLSPSPKPAADTGLAAQQLWASAGKLWWYTAQFQQQQQEAPIINPADDLRQRVGTAVAAGFMSAQEAARVISTLEKARELQQPKGTMCQPKQHGSTAAAAQLHAAAGKTALFDQAVGEAPLRAASSQARALLHDTLATACDSGMSPAACARIGNAVEAAHAVLMPAIAALDPLFEPARAPARSNRTLPAPAWAVPRCPPALQDASPVSAGYMLSACNADAYAPQPAATEASTVCERVAATLAPGVPSADASAANQQHEEKACSCPGAWSQLAASAASRYTAAKQWFGKHSVDMVSADSGGLLVLYTWWLGTFGACMSSLHVFKQHRSVSSGI